ANLNKVFKQRVSKAEHATVSLAFYGNTLYMSCLTMSSVPLNSGLTIMVKYSFRKFCYCVVRIKAQHSKFKIIRSVHPILKLLWAIERFSLNLHINKRCLHSWNKLGS